MEKRVLREVASFRENRSRFLGRLFAKSYRYMKDLAADYFTKLDYENLRIGYIMALMHVEAEGAGVNQLAQQVGMTKQGMSKLVKEMEREGYVSVEKDPSDARALVVKLTGKGLKIIHDWKNCSEFIQAHFAEILGEEKLEQLTDILETLANYKDRTLPDKPSDTLKNEYLVSKAAKGKR